MIMKQEVAIRLLQQMVQIHSPSRHEEDLAIYLKHEMQNMGFRSFIDEVGNVVGEKGDPSGPTILFLGHMDTVPDHIEVHQEGSLLYGRGTVDAKGALATHICAVAQYEHSPARLIVVGAVEEETPQSRGAHYLLERYHPDAVLIAEPSGWSSVVIGYKGRMGIQYAVQRPLCHTAGPGEKATEVALAFWNELCSYLNATDADKSIFYRTIASLCQFTGDIRHAQLDISCRLKPNFDIVAFETFLESIRGDAQLYIDERTPCTLMDQNMSTVRTLIQSIRYHGGQAKYKLKTGTSDMNIVQQHWKVPMVAYGPGDSRLDHTPNEHIHLEEYLLAITVLRDALPHLVEALQQQSIQTIYTKAEEEELNRRLEALGYLE